MKSRELQDAVRRSLLESAKLKETLAAGAIPVVIEAIKLLWSCLGGGNRVFVMGNGGSAADAQHMAAELIGRFEREREPVPCVSLTTDSSVLTALGNDFGFEEVFARQVAALARKGDLVVCFSTSGESENVIRGALKAKEMGAKVIGFLGESDASRLAKVVDLQIRIPSSRTCRIQEGHMALVHVICEALENRMSGKDTP
jgi:D-sedoheptulose 7-phosphate isomerase